MSLCQTSSNSCGACCGIFNLNLKRDEYNKLLEDRSELFRSSTDFSKRWTLSDYRKIRESKEISLNRIDDSIYVCPFLGFIEKNKIGCMIHPVYSGDPLSQNVSFYGASICQGYNCKNNAHEISDDFENFLNKYLNADYYVYSNIVSDNITFQCILDFFWEYGYTFNNIISIYKELFLDLLTRKFTIGYYLNQTSFELENSIIESKLDRLLKRLNIKKGEKLYNRTLEVTKNPFRGF